MSVFSKSVWSTVLYAYFFPPKAEKIKSLLLWNSRAGISFYSLFQLMPILSYIPGTIQTFLVLSFVANTVKTLDTPSHLMLLLYFHDYLHCTFSLKASKVFHLLYIISYPFQFMINTICSVVEKKSPKVMPE